MNCKYLKQKLNKKLECKLNNKIITLKDCNNCEYKEYRFPDVGKVLNSKKQQWTAKNEQKTAKIKNKSNKQSIIK